jgi:hypothetical protein
VAITQGLPDAQNIFFDDLWVYFTNEAFARPHSTFDVRASEFSPCFAARHQNWTEIVTARSLAAAFLALTLAM